MSGDLARRGLSGSGIEAQLLAGTYSQEAMNKASASSTARTSALQQSEAIRQQQASIAGSQLQAGTSAAGTQYQAELGGIQNIYGVTTAADYQNYQTEQAATLQGIAGLTQVAQAGQGLYAGAANYLAQASQTSGSAAQTAGSTMTSMIGTRVQADTADNNAFNEVLGTAIGSGAAAYAKSDIRLKTNIQYVENINGHNIYTWDWKEGFDGGYTKGVIAQEVYVYNPEAIIFTEDNIMMVDYKALGLDYLVEGVA